MTTLYIVSTGGGQQTLDAVGPPDLYVHSDDGQYNLTASSSGALTISRDDASGQVSVASAGQQSTGSSHSRHRRRHWVDLILDGRGNVIDFVTNSPVS